MQTTAVATRVGTAAVLGAALGAAISWGARAVADAADRQCAASSGFCFGDGWIPFLLGSAIGVVLACTITFAGLQIQPLRASVPLAILLVPVTLVSFLRAVPGGHLRPPLAVTAIMAVVFGLLAAAFTPGLRRAGAAGLAACLVAAVVLGVILPQRIQADRYDRAVELLGLPLLAPDLPGYHLQLAYPEGDVLTEHLTAGLGSTSFQVVIAHLPVTFDPPASCVPAWPKPVVTGSSPGPCVAVGPDRWTGSDTYSMYVIERRGDVLIQASAGQDAGSAGAIGVDTLTAALDSLRPVTTAQLRAANGM